MARPAAHASQPATLAATTKPVPDRIDLAILTAAKGASHIKLNPKIVTTVRNDVINKLMKRRAALSKLARQIVVGAAVFVAFVSNAGAEEASSPDESNSFLSRITIHVPLYTQHIPQGGRFNEDNWGLLVEARLNSDWSIIVGEYRNSYFRDTVVAASRYSLFAWDTSNVRIDTGVLLGFDLNGGYKGHNGVEPLLGALSIKITGNRFSDYELLNGTGIAFTILPGTIVVTNVALILRL